MHCRASYGVLLLVLYAGCPRQMNYTYQEKLPPSAFGPPDVAEPAGREARQLLASARTVAFYPPDYCINVDKEDVARSRTLRANCGVLLSSLERAAENAGYEVVSWQNLRGSQRPIDYAREAKVDVLFEINEFDFGAVNDKKLARTMEYTKYPTDGASSPFSPPPDVDARCQQYAAARRKVTDVAKIGVIDIKTVSVADGRNRWRYRKSLTKPRDVAYERLAFGSRPTTNRGAGVLTVIGAVGLAVGLGLGLAQITSTDDPMTDDDERVDFGQLPLYMSVGGGIMVAGGITISALTSRAGGPEQMCSSQPGVEPLVLFAGTGAIVDDEQENAELRSAMIGEFVDQIKDVRASMPSPPASPDPNAPQPVPAPSAAPEATP